MGKSLSNMEKNVIITGSNRGIGLAMVKKFAKDGWNIWACARKYNESFECLLKSLADDNNVIIKPVYFDLSKEQEVKEGIKNILLDKRNIDVLINNAGVPHNGMLLTTDILSMKEVYDINVFAQLLVTQLVAKRMIRQKSGCIINMCSVGGIETNPGYIAYGSSKAALIWLTKALAKELGPYNIRVNGIAPGLVDTDMGNYKSVDEVQKVLDRIVIHRMGQPEEIANAAQYLASDEATYITGQVMVIDGGRI